LNDEEIQQRAAEHMNVLNIELKQQGKPEAILADLRRQAVVTYIIARIVVGSMGMISGQDRGKGVDTLDGVDCCDYRSQRRHRVRQERPCRSIWMW